MQEFVLIQNLDCLTEGNVNALKKYALWCRAVSDPSDCADSQQLMTKLSRKNSQRFGSFWWMKLVWFWQCWGLARTNGGPVNLRRERNLKYLFQEFPPKQINVSRSKVAKISPKGFSTTEHPFPHLPLKSCFQAVWRNLFELLKIEKWSEKYELGQSPRFLL